MTELQSEHQLQAEMFKWFWNKYPDQRGLLFHVNGKAKNSIEGNKFKALGVIPGVADLVYLRPGGGIIFIEIKIPKGKQSDIQKEWESLVVGYGFEYIICRDIEHFKKIIDNDYIH